ncbi:MAG: NAD(P)-dependent oxidoreductase [Rhizobiales bacterium 35-68-8]|nr:MAG: NAD(P)-dependent oxidoreductase [Rhizobiales bacterium 35-68-8]
MSKAILITGASRGIGRATALKAAHLGWDVAVNYARDAEAAGAVVKAAGDLGVRACAVQGDVSREADVINMFSESEAGLGRRLDGVVINAGILSTRCKLVDMSAERLARIFEVNVLGAYLCAREAARRLRRGGAIVILSSMAAKLGAANEYVDYAGSKGAMDTLTTGLSKELGPEGIRVNAVRPGLIETEIHASGGYPARAQELGVQTPLGRAGTAEEVAETITWLMSDAASYVTGGILDVSGGR